MRRRWRDDLGDPWVSVGYGFAFSVLLAFVGALVLWTAWQNYQDTQYGRHGVLTVRSCTEHFDTEGRDYWECDGPFRSDDGALALDRVMANLPDEPGEVAYGWVRDTTDDTMNPVVEPVTRERFETWRFWYIVAIATPTVLGVLIGLVRAWFVRW